jgi:hypothetical protein
MDLDPTNVARVLGAICRQAIRDHQAGDPGATQFLWEASLLRTDGSFGRSTVEALPDDCPLELDVPQSLTNRQLQPQEGHPTPLSVGAHC